MTQNHLELCGVVTELRSKISELEMAFREGTLHAVADKLSDIEHAALMAGFRANDILFRSRR